VNGSKHKHYCIAGQHWYPCPEGHLDEKVCKLKSQVPCINHGGMK